MEKIISCTVNDTATAERILSQLQAAGFPSSAISVLFPDRADTKRFVVEKNTKAPEGAAAGASTGGVIGGIAGWLAGIGSLAIPGVGPFLAAGPLMAALSGAAIGATVGGLSGALVGLGIPEDEAKVYATKIKSGRILISAHTGDLGSEKTERARQIFEEAHAEDISQVAA